VEAAKKLGKLLAERKIALVYGGGNLGIMGALASSVSEHGGRVVGVIPSSMVDLSGSVKNEERIVVPDMHTRKRTMLSKSDALLALPGGFGTAEELFEGRCNFKAKVILKAIELMDAFTYIHSNYMVPTQHSQKTRRYSQY
jgi:uncharacterized protein (TIGR00730 family)